MCEQIILIIMLLSDRARWGETDVPSVDVICDAYKDIGKGREQDAEALPIRT